MGVKIGTNKNINLSICAIGYNQTINSNSVPYTLVEITSPNGGENYFNYQWQSSTNGTDFLNINDATLSEYSPDILMISTWYRLICSDDFYNIVTSNIIKITVE
jgi:hypothetical protein